MELSTAFLLGFTTSQLINFLLKRWEDHKIEERIEEYRREAREEKEKHK